MTLTVTEGLTRLSAATLVPGPRVSVTQAGGVVARLRRALSWSHEQLPRFIDEPGVYEQVALTRAEILDRRSALHVWTDAVVDLTDLAEVSLTLRQRAHAAFVVRRLAQLVAGGWDLNRGVRVLVAPNVLTQTRLLDLDQNDWCRWVALRTSIVAAHHLRAPHICQRIVDLLPGLPATTTEIVELVILPHLVATAQMKDLTTVDLPSAGWIQAHHGSLEQAEYQLIASGLTQSDSRLLHAFAQARAFADEAVAEGAVGHLFSSPDTLPTAAEYADPAAWLARVTSRV
ncbi:MAG: hypothetical protein Q4C87_00925 [Actinomycetaceae bacterium]|nr:hypothetical protein [Actinomycetaceae bacterium]